MKDISDQPMSYLEVYRLVEDHGSTVAKAVHDAFNAENAEFYGAVWPPSVATPPRRTARCQTLTWWRPSG